MEGLGPTGRPSWESSGAHMLTPVSVSVSNRTVIMAGQVVTYAVDDVAVSFEIDPVDGFVPATSSDEVVGRVRDALQPAVAAARAVLDQVKDMSPDRVEVKFGVKVTGTMNWLVAKAATEGNFEVTLAWDPAALRPTRE